MITKKYQDDSGHYNRKCDHFNSTTTLTQTFLDIAIEKEFHG